MHLDIQYLISVEGSWFGFTWCHLSISSSFLCQTSCRCICVFTRTHLWFIFKCLHLCHVYKKHPLDGSKANRSHLPPALCCPCIESSLLLLSMVIWRKIGPNAAECPSLWWWIFQFLCLLVFICAACSLELNRACLLILINNHRERENERKKSMTHGSACSHMCLHMWEQENSDWKGDANKLCNFPTIKTSDLWDSCYICLMQINDILENECVSVNCSCHWSATYWCIADRWRHSGLPQDSEIWLEL